MGGKVTSKNQVTRWAHFRDPHAQNYRSHKHKHSKE